MYLSRTGKVILSNDQRRNPGTLGRKKRTMGNSRISVKTMDSIDYPSFKRF